MRKLHYTEGSIGIILGIIAAIFIVIAILAAIVLFRRRRFSDSRRAAREANKQRIADINSMKVFASGDNILSIYYIHYTILDMLICIVNQIIIYTF